MPPAMNAIGFNESPAYSDQGSFQLTARIGTVAFPLKRRRPGAAREGRPAPLNPNNFEASSMLPLRQGRPLAFFLVFGVSFPRIHGSP